jgi:hypothetical protein
MIWVGQGNIEQHCPKLGNFASGLLALPVLAPLSCVLVLCYLSGDIIIDLAVAGNVYHGHQVGHYYILVAGIAYYGTVFHRAVLRGAINSFFYFFP